MESAAHNLLGHTLKTGWQVIEKIKSSPGSTGGFFSICYKVKKDDQICFLKAFDFARFFHNENDSVMDAINNMSTAFKYERNLSEYCKNKHVTKISFVIDSGEERVEGYAIDVVPYLIFNLADGDVRHRLKFSQNLDVAWNFRSLHDIAIGLQQLHKINVSHQDVKPSNILIFNSESKLGDLGRSTCKEIDSFYNNIAFSGDYNYAPPEIPYKYFDYDQNKRSHAVDCYLLGSLIVFYFSGTTMSALLCKHIDAQYHYQIWSGKFNEIKPYIIDAYTKSINQIREDIKHFDFNTEIIEMIEQLCFPFPEKRGHPTNLSYKHGSNYNLERYITKLDLLRRKIELNILNYGNKI